MAKDKDLKTPNVPPLRFTGFTDEWRDVQIGEVGKVVTGNTPSTKESKYYDNGTHLWASPSDLGYNKMVDSTQTLLSEIGFSKTRIIPKGSVLVTCIGSTIGKMGMAATEMSTNQQINSIVVDESNDDDFIYYSVMSRFPKYKGEIAVQAVPLISKSSFEKLDIGACELLEQRKIGKLLSLIDERIATQNKIIEDLKKLKSAIMAIIFGKSNVTKNQWCEVRLGNICERVTRRNSNNISNLILTIAAQYGLVSQTDFFNKSVASADLSNYYLLDKGNFAYNKSYSGEYTWGAVKRLDLYPQGVLSPLYICFRPI